VLDYRIYYDQGTAEWTTLIEGVTSTSYTATGLTGGETYAFKVDARNSVGYSAISQPSSILCARVPDAPTSLADDTSLTTD